MRKETLRTRVWAQCLITYEGGAKQSSESDTPAAFVAFVKLTPHLQALIGKSGTRALLSRARTLALREIPSVAAIFLNDEGCFERSSELEARYNAEELAEGRVALLARFLRLLFNFIGVDLTVRIIGDVWPELSASDNQPPNKGEE